MDSPEASPRIDPAPETEPDYLPAPANDRGGVALCLSGGGFRAALFHLGALRRLAETGALAAVDTVSSVSGGSIVAGHLAERLCPWPEGPVRAEEWEARVAAPFRDFTARTLRTRPLLARGLPWNWLRPAAAAEALAAAYAARLTRLTLPELPRRPAFVLCATDVTFGVNWTFERRRVGHWQAGYLRPDEGWTLARAVAASSCFPPIFSPLPLRVDPERLRGGRYDGADRDRLVRRLRLSDGGLYDNLGLEPVWKRHRVVLVSDGGAPFEVDAGGAPLGLLRRYLAVSTAQGASLRKRWLISSFRTGVLEGAYWGIGSATSRYGPGAPEGYGADLVPAIAGVRTDLDAFGPEETGVLENHGYLLAEAALRRHQPGLATHAATVAPPAPELLDPARARAALRGSGRRLSLARLLRRRG